MFAAAEENARRARLRAKQESQRIDITNEERAAAVQRVLSNPNASASELLMVRPFLSLTSQQYYDG